MKKLSEILSHADYDRLKDVTGGVFVWGESSLALPEDSVKEILDKLREYKKRADKRIKELKRDVDFMSKMEGRLIEIAVAWDKGEDEKK